MKRAKIKYPFYLLFAVGFFLFLGHSCKEDIHIKSEVSTTEISIITPISANCSGIVISSGSSKIIEKGICWSNSSLPTVSDNKINGELYPYFEGFNLRISGLTENTTYYVRAYATSDAGTGYGNELSFTTPIDISGEKGTVIDIEGNIYQTIGIGSQIWTSENLKTTKYNDGTSIPFIEDNWTWSVLITPAYCWYNNDELSNKDTYGALYNWYAVNTGKLCPTGWHVPDYSEWSALASFLGGFSVAGGKMKVPGTDYWKSPNLKATNESGFSALPGGMLWSLGFKDIKEDCMFWTSSFNQSQSAWYLNLSAYTAGLSHGSKTTSWGMSIRCIID